MKSSYSVIYCGYLKAEKALQPILFIIRFKFAFDTPTKWSDAQLLVEQKNNLSVVRLRFRGAKKVNKCCMFCIL